MKKTLIALATVATLAVAAPMAMARFSHGPGMRGGPNVEMMARILDLTPDQQAKMKKLFDDQAKKRDAMRTQMQTEMQSGMKSILTEEQYAKMKDLRTLRRDRRGQGMRGGCRGAGGMPGPGNYAMPPTR